MARVLWLQNLWIEFYGVMQISAVLKRGGHDCDIVFDGKEGIVEAIDAYRPDLIAFSCMSVQWSWAKEVSAYIKSRGINTPIIAGGTHVTMYPEEACLHPDIDLFCLNEGEFPMLELCDALDAGEDPSAIPNLWVRRRGGLIRNPTRPKLSAEALDGLPFADRFLYKKYAHFRDYPFEIFVGSRGCPFKCSFCEVPEVNRMYGGKSVHYRDVSRFCAELEQALEQGLLDNKLVMFTDSTFNSNRTWFLSFLEAYRARIKVPFSCNLRVDLVDDVQVRALAASGCDSVRLGVEAGDRDIRNRVLDKRLEDGQIVSVAELLHRHRVPFVTFNLFANPDETYEQAWKTIHLNQKLAPAAVGSYIFLFFAKIRATEYAIARGLLDREDLAKLAEFPYNNHLSLLALHPDRSPDAARVSNLHKLSILAIRFPRLERLIRLLDRLPPNNLFIVLYGVCQAWEWRRWSSKTTFWRLLYEGVLNYQALVEVGGGKGGWAKAISSRLSSWVTRRAAPVDRTRLAPALLESFPERIIA
jgi:anaerobic magnesium-protoporphyrin IX monomethyl ester cyclase